MRIALIGDHDQTVIAHRAIPKALGLGADTLGLELEVIWLATDLIHDDAQLEPFSAFWCVPASPYRSEEGALRAIRFAREQGRPFLGSCGGFQHALLEFARNVMAWQNAGHSESDPNTQIALVSQLSCSMIEVAASIHLQRGSRVHALYGTDHISEGYHCNYGLNEVYREALAQAGLHFCGHDDAGQVRAFELTDHPFFIATLFQGERAALRGEIPPLALGLIRAAMA